MAWYRLTVETGANGCDKVEDFEVPDAKLSAAVNEEERERIIAEEAQAIFDEMISWGYAPISGRGGPVQHPFGGEL